jgi:hypothetical protein
MQAGGIRDGVLGSQHVSMTAQVSRYHPLSCLNSQLMITFSFRTFVLATCPQHRSIFGLVHANLVKP